MGKLLLTIGLVGLCHAAYSATQHRNYLRLTESKDTLGQHYYFINQRLPPLDILLQTVLSLALTCAALVPLVARFRPIRVASDWETKTWFNCGNRVSFYSFNHRGQHLSGGPTPPSPLTSQSEEVDQPSSEDEQEQEESPDYQEEIDQHQQLERDF